MRRLVIVAGWMASVACVAFAPARAGALFTERVNINPGSGVQADGPSSSPALSADGCIVAFLSQSTTLAPASYGLTKSSPPQVYAVNRCVTPHTIELISVTNDGTAAADGGCFEPNISDDGRYVAFISEAGNLPQNSAPPNQNNLLFVRDRVAHTTLSPLEAWRVTTDSSSNISFDPGDPVKYMSADGSRFVLQFSSQEDGIASNLYAISFSGGASTLLGLCPNNTCLGQTETQYATISGDGSTIAFASQYPFATGGNGHYNIYAYNIATAVATLVSVNADGTGPNADTDPFGNLTVSGDGRLVAFLSCCATNFPGNTQDTLILKNLTNGSLSLISATANGTPQQIGSTTKPSPVLSADGSRLVFKAANLKLNPPGFPSPSDTLVADVSLGRLGSACISSSGTYGNASCDQITISADGKWAAFRSESFNLVPNDTNDQPDIFVVSLDAATDLVFASGFEP